MCLSATLYIVDLGQYYACSVRSGVEHPLYGALPVPYVPVRVTRGALVSHRYIYAPLITEPRSTT